MKSYCRVPHFEQLEQRLPLAAEPLTNDSTAESPVETVSSDETLQSNTLSDALEALNGDEETVFTTNLTGTAPGSGTAEFETESDEGVTERNLVIEVAGTTPGTHAVTIGAISLGNIVVGADGSGRLVLSSDPDEEEATLPESVTDAANMTVSITIGTTSLTGTFPASSSDDDEDDDDEDDEEEDDEEDEDEEEEDDDDDEDDDETVTTANLTGTGTGTARFETEADDGTTDRDLIIEVTGTTPGSHQVKIGTTVVGTIVVAANGTGRLELSTEPEGDEAELPAGVTSVSGQTIMVGTVLMGTFPTTPPATTATQTSPLTNEQLLAAGEQSSGTEALRAADEAAVLGPTTAIDAMTADLLLAIVGNDDPHEWESTEFVGRSDERDVAPEVLEVAFDAEESESETRKEHDEPARST